MTQMILNISDNSILPGLRRVLSRVNGVERVSIIREKKARLTKHEKFIKDFRHAIGEAKAFKDGKTQFNTWEEMMNEL